MPPLEQYKMLDHTKIKKSEVLAPAFCGFFCRAQCTGSARSGAHLGGRRRPERLKLTGKHRMSMLYRPLVSPLASRGRPEPPEAPLCEGPAAAADRCLQEVHCDRCRAAPRCRRPQPLLQLDHGDRYCPGPRLERLRSPFRSTCEAGCAASSEKPVAAVGQVGETHEFDCRRRRARRR